MSNFQMTGVPADPFAHLFELDDAALSRLGIQRVVATPGSTMPCRISLVDAAAGDELLLLSYPHLEARTPYQSSGPIYVRRSVPQAVLAPGVVADCVKTRLMSIRAYDAHNMMIMGEIEDGAQVAGVIDRMFDDERVAFIHLHNAKRGCFACAVNRVGL